MRRLIALFQKNLKAERESLSENRYSVDKRNLRVLRLILFSGMFIFGGSILLTFTNPSFLSAGYGELRFAYLVLAVACGVLFTVLRGPLTGNSTWAIYAVYFVAILYCILTSALLSPNYVSVVILAILFQIPVLYLDESWRLNLFVILGSLTYLAVIFPYKARTLFMDELINVFAFAVTALVIGQFTRTSLLENFTMKSNLQRYAYTDQLTSLFNRRKLFEDLANEAVFSSVTGLALIDVDFFKNYNDTYGHLAGDDCLRNIADCFLRMQTEYGVLFYRYGGEEFIALFRAMPQKEMLGVADTLRQRIEALAILHKTSLHGTVTISIGVAAADGIPYGALLSRADHALYAAKNGGRNTVSLYE